VRRRLARWGVLGLAVAGLAGCATGGFWTAGLANDAPTAAAGTPNGMVLVLGEPAWRVAGQRVAKDLSQVYPEGLQFDAASQDGAGELPNAEVVRVAFEGAWLHTGPVAMTVDPLGVALELTVALEPAQMTLELNGQAWCEVSVAFESGTLRGRVSLARTKLGRVTAGLLGDVSLEAPEAVVDLTDCPDLAAATGRFGVGGGSYLLEGVLDAVGLEAFVALGPALADAVPAALGLTLAADATARFGDGIGEGSLRTRVRASEAAQDAWWQLSGGRLHVPYAVGVEAKAHPCVPELAGSPPAVQSVPAVLADAALLLADNVLSHAVRSLWRAGGLCGDRAVGALSWRADALAPGWPALAALAPDAKVTLRVWPETPPELALEDSGDGVLARVGVDAWTVEVYAEVDGASLRLATMRVGLDVEAGVAVRPDRSVWLEPDSVRVTAFGATAGLLAAPDSAVVERVAGPLADAIVGARPVWWLPAFPLGPHDIVSHVGGYVVFAARPGGDIH
jgi:hypothetical protein